MLRYLFLFVGNLYFKPWKYTLSRTSGTTTIGKTFAIVALHLRALRVRMCQGQTMAHVVDFQTAPKTQPYLHLRVDSLQTLMLWWRSPSLSTVAIALGPGQTAICSWFATTAVVVLMQEAVAMVDKRWTGAGNHESPNDRIHALSSSRTASIAEQFRVTTKKIVRYGCILHT